MLCHYDAAIYHHVQLFSKHLIDLLRVIIEALIRLGDTRCNNRVFQFPYQGKGDCVVRDPDPHGLLVRQHDLGDQLCGLEDKGVRAGDESLHGPIGVIRDIGVVADIFQVCADDAQSFVLGMPFQMVDPFDGIFLVKITPEPIDGIGGIGDNPSILKDVCHFTDESLLRVLRVDFNDHMHFSLLPNGVHHLYLIPTTASAMLNVWSPIFSKLVSMSIKTSPESTSHTPLLSRRICPSLMVSSRRLTPSS
jgi:hypothetical protein